MAARQGERRTVFGLGAALILVGMAVMAVADVGVADSGKPGPADDAGERDYRADCAGCHGATLGGAFGPSLNDDAFRSRWAGKSSEALRDYIAQTMPPGKAGSFPATTYDRIAIFIRRANGIAIDRSSEAPKGPNPAAEYGSSEGSAVRQSELRDAVYLTTMARRSRRLAAVRPVEEAMLRDPPAEDWLQYRRTDDGFGFSPLHQIDRTNVSSLRLAWSYSLDPGTNGITPLVHDGVLFVNSAGTVVALDVRSGERLWSYSRPAALPPEGGPVSQPRGMAIFAGRLYVPTIDNHMIALDIRSGKPVWDHLISGMRRTLRITAAPFIVHGKVLQGMSGCAGATEPGGCFIVALDSQSGNELWRFKTIAQPGEFGGDSWNGAPADKRFGASVWTAPSYDVHTNLVYFGTGQTYHISTLMLPDPLRRPANAGLYTDSTLALNPDTGRRVWSFQHLARDVWDFDWPFERMIATLRVGNAQRRVTMTMSKLGILDALDAKTGQYLFSFDLGLQNLVTGIDARTGWKTTDPALEPDVARSRFICPMPLGVRNWPPTSYDASSRLLYVPVSRSCMDFSWLKGQDWEIGLRLRARPGAEGQNGGLVAIDLENRKIHWLRNQRAPEASGVLATAGGVVFDGSRDRHFRASDSATGKILWDVQLDNVPSASPISFAAGGVQYVAVTTGGGNPDDAVLASLTPEIEPAGPGTTLWLFKLGKTGQRKEPDRTDALVSSRLSAR